MAFGLSSDKILEILKTHETDGNINEDLKQAIVEIVAQNNKRLEKQIPDLVSKRMGERLKRKGY
ncbi:hypothetical protein [Salibacterium aidingense]|uniref:hypothetical protein n=1 Tax=Salibacterium aidingense TaxID=384933 RepID=UPI003BBDF6CA